jgi:hypothetical protein
MILTFRRAGYISGGVRAGKRLSSHWWQGNAGAAALQREAISKSVYVFVSERGAQLSVARYQRMVARAGVAARFPFLRTIIRYWLK